MASKLLLISLFLLSLTFIEGRSKIQSLDHKNETQNINVISEAFQTFGLKLKECFSNLDEFENCLNDYRNPGIESRKVYKYMEKIQTTLDSWDHAKLSAILDVTGNECNETCLTTEIECKSCLTQHIPRDHLGKASKIFPIFSVLLGSKIDIVK